MPSDDETSGPSCNAVSVKVPQFMEGSARGWFCVIEAQFKMKNITQEDTKFWNVLAALPPNLVEKLPSSLTDKQNFTDLKAAVISYYERSKPELFNSLIKKTTMSGKPSIYLRELTSIANKVGVGEELVRHQFLNSLPPTISPVLATQKTLTLEQLGPLADELAPFSDQQQANVASYSTPGPKVFPQHSSQKNNDRSRNFSSIGVTPFSPDQRPKICRGHIYFGKRSRTCKPWCEYPNKSSCNMQPNSRSSSPAPPSQSSN